MSIWMWIGLGAGITILILLLFTDFARADKSISRWLDPKWLVWLGAVIYMFHNVEEYGIDFTGTHLGFVALMTDLFGKNISTWAYLGCNIPLSMDRRSCNRTNLLEKGSKGYGSAMALFELVNGLSHVAQGFNLGYNSRLVTGIVISVPLAYWVTYIIIWQKAFELAPLLLTLGVVVLYHVILIAGCRMAVANQLLGFGQFVYMTVDAAMLVGANYWINKKKTQYLEAKQVDRMVMGWTDPREHFGLI